MKTLLGFGIALSAGFLVLSGCAPPPANQAASNPAASPPAPPSPPPPPPSGVVDSPGPPGEVSPAVAPAGAAPAETAFGNPLSALSPLSAYEDLDRRINAVLSKVTDGPSADVAADELAPLTAELKLKLRPYIAAVAAMSDEEQLAYVQRNMEEAIRQKSSGGGADHRRLIDLARQPGNERFKAALQAMFQTMIDEGNSGTRRDMTQMLERLNRP